MMVATGLHKNSPANIRRDARAWTARIQKADRQEEGRKDIQRYLERGSLLCLPGRDVTIQCQAENPPNTCALRYFAANRN